MKNVFPKYRFIIPVVIIISLLLSSCFSTRFFYIDDSELREVEIEVFRPAEVNIPYEIYRVIFATAEDNKNQTRIYEFYNQKLVKNDRYLNNNPVNKTLNNVRNYLKGSPRFKIMNDKPVIMNYNDNNDWLVISNIAKRYHADGIILVDNFKSRLIKRVYKVFYGSFNNPSIQLYFNQQTFSDWKFLDVKNQELIDRITLNSSNDWIKDNRQENFRLQDYLGDAGDNLNWPYHDIAYRYAERISPMWKQEVRTFFTTDHPDFNQATVHVYENNWDKAKALWQKHLDSENHKYRKNAIYNMALVYEIEGDLKKALQMATKAAKEYYIGEARNYKKLLQERIADQEKLKKQMEGEND